MKTMKIKLLLIFSSALIGILATGIIADNKNCCHTIAYATPSHYYYTVTVELFNPQGELVYNRTLTMQQYLYFMETGDLETDFVFDRPGIFVVRVIITDTITGLFTVETYTITVTGEAQPLLRSLIILGYPQSYLYNACAYRVGILSFSGEGVFAFGTLVTVTATAPGGFSFVGWYERMGLSWYEKEKVSEAINFSFYMPDRDLVLFALFEQYAEIPCGCNDFLYTGFSSCLGCGSVYIGLGGGGRIGLGVLFGLTGAAVLIIVFARRKRKT